MQYNSQTEMPKINPETKRHTLETSLEARTVFKVMAAKLNMTAREFSDWLAARAQEEFDRWEADERAKPKPTSSAAAADQPGTGSRQGENG